MHSFGEEDPDRKKYQNREHHTDKLGEPSSTHQAFIFDLFLFQKWNKLFIDRRNVLRNVAHFTAVIVADSFDRRRCQFDGTDSALFDKIFEVGVGYLLGHSSLIVHHTSQAVSSVAYNSLEDQYDDDREECKSKQGVVVKKIVIVIVAILIVVLWVIHGYPWYRSV